LLVKYGVDHFAKTREFADKTKKKWEAKTPEQLSQKRIRQKTTLIAQYGDKFWEQSAAKRKLTNLSKYGVEDASALPETVKKREETMSKRYGVKNFSHSPLCRPRMQATWLAKYGVSEVFSSRAIQQTIRSSNIEKYGKAYPARPFGKVEEEIKAWILSEFGLEFKSDTSILDGKEIDLYNDTIKLGIEYCGLFWHCQNPVIHKENSDKNIHFNKFKLCAEKGVRLITIFEDEWLSRKDQVKGFLRSILGKNAAPIYARKCEVHEIDKKEGCKFIAQHHIQGSNTLGKYFAGIFYQSELLGVMSFGKHHRNKDILILDRLCFKDGARIVGGASRLFQFLLKITSAQKVSSWSDNRWSIGDVYRKMGFKEAERMRADYSYCPIRSKKLYRVSKQSQQKSATGCPPEITEREWAAQHGLYRIWDCGKVRWEWIKN
jgi:hypothetical protein